LYRTFLEKEEFLNASTYQRINEISPFSRSLLHWPIQQAAMANTAGCIGHRSLLCEMGQFFVWLIMPRPSSFRYENVLSLSICDALLCV